MKQKLECGDQKGKRLLSVQETAFYLGLSPRTIYNAVAPKSKAPFPVKPKRIGKLVRFDVRELDRYVDGLNDGLNALDTVSNIDSQTPLNKGAEG